jgi:nucleoside-diphosphate-sugar epimerase
MRLLITGGSGFLGSSVARELLKQSTIQLEGRDAGPITELILTDLVAPANDLQSEPRVRAVVGDLSHLLNTQALTLDGVDAVVHLAAAVSGECEANLDLGLQSNLQTSLTLLQAARHQAKQPVFVFASSVAVFGAPAGQHLPPSISDTYQPTPQSSYGIQKFMVEQLVADFSRKGLIHGRNVRLMTVSVRPGKPNGAASSFLSGMFREPLAGQACTVPVPADTRVALASVDTTLQGLLCALTTPTAQWGPATAVNLPALTTTVGEMAQALKEVAGDAVAALLDWTVNPQVQTIISGWPSQFDNHRAKALGLVADASVKSLIQSYATRHPDAVRCTLTF